MGDWMPAFSQYPVASPRLAAPDPKGSNTFQEDERGAL
jgi:hypothetical protein